MKEKDEIISKLLSIMADKNNTIDLDAYARGLIDMYEYFKPTYADILPNYMDDEKFKNIYGIIEKFIWID